MLLAAAVTQPCMQIRTIEMDTLFNYQQIKNQLTCVIPVTINRNVYHAIKKINGNFTSLGGLKWKANYNLMPKNNQEKR